MPRTKPSASTTRSPKNENPNAASPPKEWTIMVYLAGDNNLSENMAYSLEDLRSATGSVQSGTRDKFNLLAYFDSNSLTAPTHYVDFSEAEPVRVEARKTERPHPNAQDKAFFRAHKNKQYYGDGNSASAYSIMNFVHWCIETQKRTARNYILIFSGHSFGFHGTSFLRDDSDGGFITLFKFRWALEQIKNLYFGGNKIAMLGFDSCVMSMLEIGCELDEVAQTIVASEGSLPNSGWGYTYMLQQFVSQFEETQRAKWLSHHDFEAWRHTESYVKTAAAGFVDAFINQQTKLAIGGRSIDIAAWDLDKVEPVAARVNELAVMLNEYLYLVDKVQKGALTDNDIAVYQELKKVLLQSHFDSQTYMKEQCVDLKDFCQRLILECKFLENGVHGEVFSTITEKCKEIIQAVDECVLKCGFSGDEYQFSNGISLYFPWSHITYYLTDYRYRYLRFIKGKWNQDHRRPRGIGKDWNTFLFNYLTRVTLRIARKQKTSENGWTNSLFEDFSKQNPVWRTGTPLTSKDNPIWSKDNPTASKDNPTASKDNPPASKDNPTASRDNPTASRGELGNYLFYFSRFKNFQMQWEISGFADDFRFEQDFDEDVS